MGLTFNRLKCKSYYMVKSLEVYQSTSGVLRPEQKLGFHCDTVVLYALPKLNLTSLNVVGLCIFGPISFFQDHAKNLTIQTLGN